MPPMTRLPVGEPAQTSLQEPDGSLEALAAATIGEQDEADAAASSSPTWPPTPRPAPSPLRR